ncbi:MAG: nucleotidyltransferase family protein, partial [Dehalococcoidales bacterium]|nr:nucleotidyltransferase family protein [Dehalococcoidales bacterium]
MKAVLLAAGRGERLGEVTQQIPKPLLPVRGKPVIVHNIELCRKYDITEIFINLHHLPDVIKDVLGDGGHFGVSITYSYEKTILGTAGGVKHLAGRLQQERFFVIYADNYSDYDLDAIKNRHTKARADMSIAVFEKEDIRHSGVAVMDKDGWIKQFVEKPTTAVSHWVNAGIYLMEPFLLDLIPNGFSDFGRDIIPELLSRGCRVLGVKMDKPV